MGKLGTVRDGKGDGTGAGRWDPARASLSDAARLLADDADEIYFRVAIRPIFRLVYVSPSVEALLGYEPDELYAKASLARLLMGPGGLAGVGRKVTDDAGADFVATRLKVELRRADGGKLAAHVQRLPLIDDGGQVIGWHGRVRPIGRDRSAELLRQIEQVIAAWRRGNHPGGLLPAGRSDLGADLGALTEREHEVVRLVAAGHANKEIAATLGISLRTVEMHRGRAMRKLNMRSPIELVRYLLLTEQPRTADRA